MTVVVTKLCPPCTQPPRLNRNMRAMNTHETPWIAIKPAYRSPLSRIKSPQLYRLSYRPECMTSLLNLSSVWSLNVGFVPAVYPCPYTGATYSECGSK